MWWKMTKTNWVFKKSNRASVRRSTRKSAADEDDCIILVGLNI